VIVTCRKRRIALVAFLAGCTSLSSTGCTSGGMSMASLNPFKKTTDPVAAVPPASSTIPGKLAAMKQSATGQASSVGMASKNAFTKTKNGVTGLFKGKTESTDASGTPLSADDPTRLDSPASVGPDVFVAQGQLWETTGDFPKAMQSYTRALEGEPKNAAALASVARLHFRQENYQPAADYFRRALEQSPNAADLHNDYGLTQAKLKDMAGATQSITKALTLAPGTSRFANNLANVKYDSGDSQGSLAVLMQHNKPAVAHFNMAYLHYKAGKLPEAKTHLAEVVKYEPQAAGDSSVGKAVARSKEMLAQIEGPATRIAQAAPKAAEAAGQFMNAFQQPVQQSNLQGATGTAPAMQATAIAPNAGSSPQWMGSPATPPGAVPAQAPKTPPGTTAPQTPFTLPPNFYNQ